MDNPNELFGLYIAAMVFAFWMGVLAKSIWDQYRSAKFLERQWTPTNRRIRGVN